MYQLVRVRDSHRYVFRWESPFDLPQLNRELCRLANDTALNFTWKDAADLAWEAFRLVKK